MSAVSALVYLTRAGASPGNEETVSELRYAGYLMYGRFEKRPHFGRFHEPRRTDAMMKSRDLRQFL